MKTINTVVIVENIVTLLRPYITEMNAVPGPDRPFVLRRLQHELRRRIASATSVEILQQYRDLDRAIELDLTLIDTETNENPGAN